MKRLILALTFAAATFLFTSGPAFADCTTNTVFGPGGKVTICIVCCNGTNCFTNCF
jgi:hypothetical protein